MIVARAVNAPAVSPHRCIIKDKKVTPAFVQFVISQDMTPLEATKLVLLSFQRSEYGGCVILRI